MSIRTIIEINHDYIRPSDEVALLDLFRQLGMSTVPAMLNANAGKPVRWSSGVTIYGQRHHSEALKVTFK